MSEETTSRESTDSPAAQQPARLEHPMVFANLVVSDVKAATAFYRALGWKENQVFRDETTSSMEVSDAIVVMLLEESKFAQFNDRDSYRPGGPREVLNCLQCTSKEDVDELLTRARGAGAKVTREAEAQGPMYGAAFDDLDGHGWELMWMDPAALAEMGQ